MRHIATFQHDEDMAHHLVHSSAVAYLWGAGQSITAPATLAWLLQKPDV